MLKMLKMLKGPLVRSSLVVVLLGGVAALNFKSIAEAECYGVCFHSPFVWLKFKNTTMKLCGAYIVAAFPSD